LVVDDEPHIRFVLEHKLRNAGYHVVTAKDGVEGLEEFQRCSPSLAIVDLRMPRMHGDVLCVRLRALPDGDTPIILLTGSVIDETELRRTMGELAAVRHMSKPFSPQDLLDTVRQILEVSETAG